MRLASQHRLDACRLLGFAAFAGELSDLDQVFAQVLVEHRMAADFQRSTRALDLSFVGLGDPPPGGAHPKRAILYSPALSPRSTVVATNLEDGWETMVNCLAGKIAGVHVLVRTSADGVENPVQSFEMWKDGSSRRVVQVLKDVDRWEFFSRGPVQSFETGSNYDRRRKRDRLAREHLIQYLGRLGWDFSHPDFWRSDRPAVYYAEDRG